MEAFLKFLKGNGSVTKYFPVLCPYMTFYRFQSSLIEAFASKILLWNLNINCWIHLQTVGTNCAVDFDLGPVKLKSSWVNSCGIFMSFTQTSSTRLINEQITISIELHELHTITCYIIHLKKIIEILKITQSLLEDLLQ